MNLFQQKNLNLMKLCHKFIISIEQGLRYEKIKSQSASIQIRNMKIFYYNYNIFFQTIYNKKIDLLINTMIFFFFFLPGENIVTSITVIVILLAYITERKYI